MNSRMKRLSNRIIGIEDIILGMLMIHASIFRHLSETVVLEAASGLILGGFAYVATMPTLIELKQEESKSGKKE